MKENKYFRIFIRPTRCANKKKVIWKKEYIKYYIIYPRYTAKYFFLLLIKLNKNNPMK